MSIWLKSAAIGALAYLSVSLPSASIAATRWSIDPAHSRIAFGIDAVGYPRTKGMFRKFSGRVDIDFDRPELSDVMFQVNSSSVDVGSSSFDDYLKSDGYLDAARHPDIEFVSHAVRKIDDRTIRVDGDLTLLGVTRPLSVEVTVARDPRGAHGRLGFEAHARINRLEFGMNAGFPVVSGEIDLDIAAEALSG